MNNYLTRGDSHAKIYIDSSTERIINYLSTSYGVGINAVKFQYFKDDAGRELVSRVFLIDPSQSEQNIITKLFSKRKTNLSYEELQQIAKDNGVEEIYRYFYDGLLKGYLGQAAGTRSSIAFKKDGKTILSLIPGESNSDSGLKFRLYTTRFAECFGISVEQAIDLLPEHKHEWEYYSGATPEWSGHEGYFKDIEEVNKWLTGLSEVMKK